MDFFTILLVLLRGKPHFGSSFCDRVSILTSLMNASTPSTSSCAPKIVFNLRNWSRI